MRATGIVRRVDELGRVVIPKEIRRFMKIEVGEPLEIYTDRDGGILFKKYGLYGNVDPDSLVELADDRRLTLDEREHLHNEADYLRRLIREIGERD